MELCSHTILRVVVGQVGIGPFDAERLERPHTLQERLRVTEPHVQIVDLLDVNMTNTDFTAAASGMLSFV
jgi:hypothetical protein